MAITSKHKRHIFPVFSSTHFRYSLIFICLSAVFLLFLNVYVSSMLRSSVFHSRQSSITSQQSIIAASLAELDTLTTSSVTAVMELLDEMNVTRIMITDNSGEIVYDSSDENQLGRMAIYPEIVHALEGYDVFYCKYDGGKILSHAAVPVMNYGNPTGAVFILDIDNEQGAFIYSIEHNVLYLSIILEAAVLVISFFFASYFSTRTRKIIHSIRNVREGDYSARIGMRGNDEVGWLAREFDTLTDRLRSADESRRRFVSDASHELKTPLAAVKLLSDSILQNDMDKETILEFVGDIGLEADRLTRMTHKLLDLSRMDGEMSSGTDETVQQEISDVRQAVEASVSVLKPLAEMNFVDIVTDLEEGCTVLAFEDDVHQIVFNLIDNAIKYNREDGHIWVTLRKEADSVMLQVSDSGIGIPADDMEHIFERFYRVDKARSRERGGSGLGLSLVHDMVIRNHGDVSVSQRDGGGSCFKVVFPLFAVSDVTEEEAKQET